MIIRAVFCVGAGLLAGLALVALGAPEPVPTIAVCLVSAMTSWFTWKDTAHE